MSNEINAFELTDEQLETVAGGSVNIGSIENAGNGLVQLNLAAAPTFNFSGINLGNAEQEGASISQSNQSSQKASNK